MTNRWQHALRQELCGAIQFLRDEEARAFISRI